MFQISFIPFLLLFTCAILVERLITQISWCGASIIYIREDKTIPQFQHLEEEKTILYIKEAHHIYQSNGTRWNQIEGLFEDIQMTPADSRQRNYATNACGEKFLEIESGGFSGIRLNKMSWKWILAFKKQLQRAIQQLIVLFQRWRKNAVAIIQNLQRSFFGQDNRGYYSSRLNVNRIIFLRELNLIDLF